MKIKIYRAECGDAICINYIGSDNKPHNIFIDAGYERTFRNILRKEIQIIQNKNEIIDLFILSHIHDDHIGGGIAYIKSVICGESVDIVDKWFYNPPRTSFSNFKTITKNLISEAKSIMQGDTISSYLYSNKKYPPIDITSKLPPFNLFGMDIFILSPDESKLNSLRSKYPPKSKIPFEKIELDSISLAKGVSQNDYNIPINTFNIERWQEDESIENGSSISLLTKYNNIKTLWLTDSHPGIIIDSLNNLGYSINNPLECNWVQVAHHGSVGNNSNELYDIIKCQNYLISANGENRYNLPTKECIARILRNKKRSLNSHYNFYFTYDNELLRSMFDIDGTNIFSDLNFSVHYLDKNSNMIELN